MIFQIELLTIQSTNRHVVVSCTFSFFLHHRFNFSSCHHHNMNTKLFNVARPWHFLLVWRTKTMIIVMNDNWLDGFCRRTRRGKVHHLWFALSKLKHLIYSPNWPQLKICYSCNYVPPTPPFEVYPSKTIYPSCSLYLQSYFFCVLQTWNWESTNLHNS